MKKFLLFVTGLILVVIAAVMIIGLIEPRSVVITRSRLINASKESVFEQVVRFRNWPNWSPWYRMNPNMTLAYEGADGQPGSSYHWSGGDEKKTGEGIWKNAGVDGTKMDYTVSFIKPLEHTATGFISTADTAGMTRMTWSCNVAISFPFNAMFLVMDLDKALGPDFDSGLNNMKNFMEGRTPAVVEPGIDIKEVDFPAHMYAGIRKTVRQADIMALFTETNRLLLQDQAIAINGPSTALYYAWDTVNNTADIASVYPVADTATPVKGATFIQVPAARAYMVVYKGGYSKMQRYHAAMKQHLANKMERYSMVIEEYVTGKLQQPDTSKWITHIYYLVQQ